MYNNFIPKCGEIWMCNLYNKEGSIQSGYRPVFVISNDKNNTYSPTLNIIPITSKMNKRRLPVHVELWDCEKYGLKVPSTLMIEQITTISSECLDKRLGEIGDKFVLDEIWNAISIQFPIAQMAAV